MPVYLVHVPPAGKDLVKTALRTSFTRDGFKWGAFAFGPLWLLRHRLWLELFFFIVVAGLLFVGREFYGLEPEAMAAIYFVIAVFLGYEGTSMLEGKLERKGFRCADVVAGSNIDEIERRFFARWTGTGAR